MAHPRPGSPARYGVRSLLALHREELERGLQAGKPLAVLAGLLGYDRLTVREAANRMGWRFGWYRRRVE